MLAMVMFNLPVNNKAMWAYKEGELPNPRELDNEKAERKLSAIMNKDPNLP